MRRWLSAFAASLLAGLFCSVSCYRPVLHDCVVKCALDGSCPDGATCSNGWCTTGAGACERPLDGAAEPEPERCAAGDTERCAAPDRVERCLDSTLTWTTAELCADDTPVCVAGRCRACAPGARACVEADAFETCAADGSWEGAVSACPLEQPRCVGGACRPPVQVTAGGAHTCVVGASGNVRCFGDNTFGQLGVGDRQARGASTDPPPADAKLGSFVAVAVSAGGSHTCALDAAGSVRCWGQNGGGQLGLGDREARGGDAATLGDSLAPVELGLTPIVALSAGDRHTCGLLADGRVKCWGANESGQLGLRDRRARGGRPEDMGEALPSVELGRDVHALVLDAGDNHTCAVLADGRAKCWGENEYGQLGLAGGDAEDRSDGVPAAAVDTTSRALGVSAGGNHTCIVFADQRVSCFGSHAAGQIGADPPPGATVVNIDAGVPEWVELGRGALELAAGASHTCALLLDRNVKCWGLNVAGQLGYGDVVSRGRKSSELGDGLALVDLGEAARGHVTSIAAGLDVSCAAYGTDGVKCWGLNASGQLGQGDTESRGDELGELGDALLALPLD